MSLCYAILNTMLVICLLIFLLKNDYKHFSHEANIKKLNSFGNVCFALCLLGDATGHLMTF